MKPVSAILVMVLLMGSVWAQCDYEVLGWKKLHERAEETELSEALSAVEKNPQSLKHLYLLGILYLNEYKAEEAERVFRLMLDIDISCIPAQWGVAECLRRKRQCEICIRLLEEIIASRPDFSPAYITLAYIRHRQGNFDESARLSYRVIKQGKEDVDLTNYLRAHGLFAGAKGMIAHYGGPLSKAINGRQVLPYLKKAERLKADAPSVLFGLGSYYLLTPPIFGRDLDKALEYLTQAVKADPLFPDVYVRLAQVYKAKGEERKYEHYLAKALQLDPQNELALDIKNNQCQFICVEAGAKQ